MASLLSQSRFFNVYDTFFIKPIIHLGLWVVLLLSAPTKMAAVEGSATSNDKETVESTHELAGIKLPIYTMFPGQRREIEIQVPLSEPGAFLAQTAASTCGCTLLKGLPFEISNNVQSTLQVMLAADNRLGEKEVSIRVNGLLNGKKATLPITIGMSIIDGLVPESESWSPIRLASIKKGEKVTKRLSYKRGAHPQKWDTHIVSMLSSDLGWRILESKVESDTIYVNVEYMSGPILGISTGYISFKLNQAGVPLDYTPRQALQLKIDGDYSTSPSQLLIGVIPNGLSQTAKIQVKSNSGQPFEIKEIKNSVGANLEIKNQIVSRDQAGKTLTVEFEFKNLGMQGQITGYIDLITAETNATTIRVPYLAAGIP